jgi:NitT/TauT family transport system substrate-binding protein
MDLMIANTEVLKDNPNFGKALVGIWYDTMKAMSEGTAAKEAMAKASGTDLKGYDAQLATTQLFSEPKAGVAFMTSPEVKTTSEKVSTFLFDKALLGKDAKSPGAIGIEFPDKSVFGEKGNVKLRFDATYMQAAADGKL